MTIEYIDIIFCDFLLFFRLSLEKLDCGPLAMSIRRLCVPCVIHAKYHRSCEDFSDLLVSMSLNKGLKEFIKATFGFLSMFIKVKYVVKLKLTTVFICIALALAYNWIL